MIFFDSNAKLHSKIYGISLWRMFLRDVKLRLITGESTIYCGPGHRLFLSPCGASRVDSLELIWTLYKKR